MKLPQRYVTAMSVLVAVGVAYLILQQVAKPGQGWSAGESIILYAACMAGPLLAVFLSWVNKKQNRS